VPIPTVLWYRHILQSRIPDHHLSNSSALREAHITWIINTTSIIIRNVARTYAAVRDIRRPLTWFPKRCYESFPGWLSQGSCVHVHLYAVHRISGDLTPTSLPLAPGHIIESIALFSSVLASYMFSIRAAFRGSHPSPSSSMRCLFQFPSFPLKDFVRLDVLEQAYVSSVLTTSSLPPWLLHLAQCLVSHRGSGLQQRNCFVMIPGKRDVVYGSAGSTGCY